MLRKWHARDYQAPGLRRAALIAAARKVKSQQIDALLAELLR